MTRWMHLGPPVPVAMDLGSTEAVKQAVKNGLGSALVLVGAVDEERRVRTLGVVPVAEPSRRKRTT